MNSLKDKTISLSPLHSLAQGIIPNTSVKCQLQEGTNEKRLEPARSLQLVEGVEEAVAELELELPVTQGPLPQQSIG